MKKRNFCCLSDVEKGEEEQELGRTDWEGKADAL